MTSTKLKAGLILIKVISIAALELSPDGLNVCADCETRYDEFKTFSCCEGWANGNNDGSDCITPICNNPCGEHGTCTSPDVCTCEPGYAGEICDTESHTMYEARLLYGKEPHEGLVQIRSEDGTWSYIHPDTWSRNNSHVFCKQLGFSFAYILSDGDWTDNIGNSFSFLDIRFECSGNEDALHDCDVDKEHGGIADNRVVVIQCYVPKTDSWCNENCDWESKTICKCDPLCNSYGDCCPDYYNNDNCPPEINVNLNREKCSPMPLGHKSSRRLRLQDGYFFISDCSTSWVYDDISRSCENQPDISDPLTFTPVQERNFTGPVNRVYRNIFCAICNFKLLHELQAWDILVETGEIEEPAGEPVIYNVIPPNGEGVPRACILNLESGGPCYDHHRDIKRSCANDYDPLDVQDKRYQNIFCAVCDDILPKHQTYSRISDLKLPMVRRELHWQCHWLYPIDFGDVSFGVSFPVGYPDIPPLITIFDFGSDGNVQNGCNEREMYDYFSQRCRLLSCPIGFALSNGSCEAIKLLPERGLPKEIFEYNQTMECVYNALVNYFVTVKQHQNNGIRIPATDIIRNSDTNVVIHANSSSFSQLTRSVNDMLISEYRNEPESEEKMCNVSSLLVLHELQDIVVDESKNDAMITCIHRNQMLGCVSKDGLMEIDTNITVRSYEFIWKSETSCYGIRATWVDCSNTVTSCAGITLAPDEFEIYTGKNTSIVLLKTSGKELSHDEFIFGENGTIFVCGSVLYPEEHKSKLDEALSYVTFGCFVFSLVATFFTVISYCVFKELRNVSGYTIINLSIAFFVAQLAFLISPYLLQPTELCLTSAVIGHFAWLSGFFWMNALSFVTANTLSRNTLVRDKTMETCRLIRYMVYAWGSPLLIVGVCISIHFCDCTDIAPIYGLKGSSLCWLIGQDGYANLWGFAGPVVALLFCNKVMFIHAIAALRAKMASTRRSFKKVKEEIVIYLKLSTLMGIPWMLGFVLAFVPEIYLGNAYIYLNYIYTILNSLQGFFIFWVLVLTGRAGKLWHRKLCGSRRLLGTKKQSSKSMPISSGKITTSSFTVSSVKSRANSSSDEPQSFREQLSLALNKAKPDSLSQCT